MTGVSFVAHGKITPKFMLIWWLRLEPLSLSASDDTSHQKDQVISRLALAAPPVISREGSAAGTEWGETGKQPGTMWVTWGEDLPTLLSSHPLPSSDTKLQPQLTPWLQLHERSSARGTHLSCTCKADPQKLRKETCVLVDAIRLCSNLWYTGASR